MPSLFIHIGHGKTGSSYIQSTIANSRKSIEAQGYIYPYSRNLKSAASGKISSGNFLEYKDFLSNITSEENTLFSSEKFFHLLRKEHPQSLWRKTCDSRYEKIELLLLIRDPIDHAPSSYQQTIKQGGYHWSIEEFFESYQTPSLVLKLIHQCQNSKKINLSIKNYSRHKKTLIKEFCHWSGLDEEKLTTPPTTNVNRSMTRAELEFQRRLNKHIGKSGRILSDPLCNNLPEISSETLLPPISVQEKMLERLRLGMEEVNSYIDKKEDKYLFRTLEPTSLQSEETYLSSRQTEIIADNLGKELKRLQAIARQK